MVGRTGLGFQSVARLAEFGGIAETATTRSLRSRHRTRVPRIKVVASLARRSLASLGDRDGGTAPVLAPVARPKDGALTASR